MNHVQQQQRHLLACAQIIWAGQPIGCVRMDQRCSNWLKKPTGTDCLR